MNLFIGQGLPAPSFTVVAADMENSRFIVIRPYVVMIGYGEIPVSGAQTGFVFGDVIWCNITKEADGFDGEGGAAFTWTANLSTEEDDDAVLSVKIAEIPRWTGIISMGGVQQYHSGVLVIPAMHRRKVVTKTVYDPETHRLYNVTRGVYVLGEDSSSSSSSVFTAEPVCGSDDDEP